jgi:hypothetical protein
MAVIILNSPVWTTSAPTTVTRMHPHGRVMLYDALRTYLSLVMLQALRALLLLSSIVVLDLAFDPCSYEY